jgi:hypothetical protein
MLRSRSQPPFPVATQRRVCARAVEQADDPAEEDEGDNSPASCGFGRVTPASTRIVNEVKQATQLPETQQSRLSDDEEHEGLGQ